MVFEEEDIGISPDELTAVLEDIEPVPHNMGVIRGIKYQTIWEFVRYLKNNCAGTVNADMTVSLDSMTYEELDKIAEGFLKA